MLTVVSKHVYAIVAWGKSHGYKSIKVENIKQVTTDFEMLGRKPLREKYFAGKEEDDWTRNGNIWLYGYGFEMVFSDNSTFSYEFEGDGAVMSKDSSNIEVVYGSDWKVEDIFPEIEGVINLLTY
jgi:hypothetical protein